VLRAKMVDYLMLPGQSGFTGNAAAGAALLNELQASPLSGNYTAFNYYLQSAIDQGSLGGMQSQVGGQVRADAAAYLLRQPYRLDDALAPYAAGRDLAVGQTGMWLTGWGGYVATNAHDGAAGSSEQSAGPLIGATHVIDTHTSVFMALGYDWGQVGSAGATGDVGIVLGTIGGRYAFRALAEGPYVDARADVGGVDYQDTRPLGGGLGTARGNGAGMVYGGQAVFGDILRGRPGRPCHARRLSGDRQRARVGRGSPKQYDGQLARRTGGRAGSAVAWRLDHHADFHSWGRADARQPQRRQHGQSIRLHGQAIRGL